MAWCMPISPFYDWKHNFYQFRLGGTVKPEEEKADLMNQSMKGNRTIADLRYG